MRKKIIISIFILFYIATYSTATSVFGEYIRATNEDELIFVSTKSEVRIGKSLSKKVEKNFGVDDDVFLRKRIDSIGQKIAAVCDRKDIEYFFTVLKGEDLKPEQRMNAFALPGGYIYIFRDMLKFLESDDEIAAVLAHEVGHIAAKHSIKRMQGSLGALAFQIMAAGISQNSATAGRTNYALGLLMRSYSREDESAADKMSVKYLKKVGYDPKAVIKTLDKMEELHKKMPIRKYTAYRSHPYLAERRAAARTELYGKIDFVDFINTPATLGEQ